MGFYTSLEEKWYSFLDKLEGKGIHVYGIVDQIDKVIPSFILLLIVVALLIIGGILLIANFMPAVMPQAAYKLYVLDMDGKGVATTINLEWEKGGKVAASNTDGYTPDIKDIPANADVTISVEDTKYETFSEEIKWGGAEFANGVYKITLEKIIVPPKTYRFYIKDTETGALITKSLTVTFSCRNIGASAPASKTVSTGTVDVTEPDNCGGLLVSIRPFDNSYEALSSEPLTTNGQSIMLQASEFEKSTITVNVKINGQFVTDAMTVTLYKNSCDAGTYVSSAVAQNGQAVFSTASGTYCASTTSTAKYASGKSEIVSVGEGDAATATINLSESIAGQIIIQVLDKKTNEKIGNALVTLKWQDSIVESQTTAADKNATVSFSLKNAADYTVIVNHEDYCLETKENVQISAAVQVIKLEKFTPACGSTLHVKVVDKRDNKPINNAVVGLFSEERYSLGLKEKISDINGDVEFTGIRTGKYTAFAYKGNFSGWSEVMSFDERDSRDILTVAIDIPNGNINLKVTDRDGKGIQFAEVSLLDSATNEKVGGGSKPVESITGDVNFIIKADKLIYAVVTKSGYTDYTSAVYSIPANGTRIINVILEPEIISGDISIEFTGLYTSTGMLATVLAPGNEYTVKFKLRIPKNSGYDKIGLHARVGTHSEMELDKILIKKLNIPGSANIIKSTSYNPPAGYEVDAEHITSGDAKWASVEWQDFRTGIIEASADVKIKQNASPEDEIKLYYRAWGITNDQKYKRAPYDSDLGEAESIPAKKQSLYAKAYEEVRQVGEETLCTDKFCFNASILDEENDIVQQALDFYTTKIFGDYTLRFTLLNNSMFETDSYPEAEIKISNLEDAINIRKYSIYGAQNQNSSNDSLNANETGWIGIGDFNPNNSISGTAGFTPTKVFNSPILIQIKSMQRIVYEKAININCIAKNEFAIETEPLLIPSGVENELKVTVRNKADQLEVEGALVKIVDKFTTEIAKGNTNSVGIALLEIPPQKPGTKLKIIVEKANYMTLEQEIETNPEVIKLTPESIAMALNIKNKLENETSFNIQNLTEMDLKIQKMEWKGDSKGNLDEIKMKNWLYVYEEDKVKAEETMDVVVKGFLSDNALKLNEAKEIDSTIILEMGALEETWEFTIPFKISIGIGGEVDDPLCFSISKTEWKASTEGTPVQVELEIRNNCTVEQIPVSLKDVRAKILWESNPLGKFDLRTESFSRELSSGYAKIIVSEMDKEGRIAAVLTFGPEAGVNGEAKAKIIFEADNATESGKQTLSAELSATINAINLLDCVLVDPDIVYINPQQTGMFTVETTGCGEKTEITIDSELTVDKEKFGLEDKESAEVTVSSERSYPGQYPIYVYAKSESQTEKKIIDVVRIRIPSSGCLALSRYEFDIYDDPNNPYDGYDTVSVINQCYDKRVSIKVDTKSWGKAMEEGLKWALIGLVFGYLEQLGEKKTPSQPATPPATNTVTNTQTFSDGAGGTGQAPPEIPGNGTDDDGDGTVDEFSGDCRKDEDCQAVFPGSVCLAGHCGSLDPRTAAAVAEIPNNNIDDDEDGSIDELCGNGLCELPGEGNGNCEFDCPPADAISFPDVIRCGDGICTADFEDITTCPEDCTPPCNTNDDCNPNEACVEGLCILIGNAGGGGESDGGDDTPPEEICGDGIDNDGDGQVDEGCADDEGTCGDGMCDEDESASTCPQDCPEGSDFAEKKQTATGFVVLQAPTGTSGSDGLGGLGSMFGNAAGGAMGGIGSLIGSGNPFTTALTMFIAGTLMAYNSQKDILLTYNEKNLVYESPAGLSLWIGEGLPGSESQETRITILDLNQATYELYRGQNTTGTGTGPLFTGPPATNTNVPPATTTGTSGTTTQQDDETAVNIEIRDIAFQNTGGLEQSDPFKPEFRLFKIAGTKLYYEKNYKKKAPAPGELTITNEMNLTEKFHVQFNAYKPEEGGLVGIPRNCILGSKIGSTGENAAPKIKMDWDFDGIGIDACDELEMQTGNENNDYIYCDATQFSIELLKKINEIKNFVETHSFDCPSAATAGAIKEQALNENEKDIGIVKIEMQRDSSSNNNVKALVTVKSINNTGASDIPVFVTVYDVLQDMEQVGFCETTAMAVGNDTAECTIEGLENIESTMYEAQAEIITSELECANCKDNDTGNNYIATRFSFSAETGLEECEPYNTSRLAEFMQATETKGSASWSNAEKEKILRAIKFNVHLMNDGYTNDFRNDFDDFMLNKGFLAADSFYRSTADTKGLREFFVNTEHFAFNYYGAPHAPIDAGKYTVEIGIDFGNEDATKWKFFNSNKEPSAVVTVNMDKLSAPEPDSPFYYLPFDGLVGIESDNGRQGYGVNYRQESQNTIKINEYGEHRQHIFTTNIANSTPIFGGWVTARIEDNFEILNNGEGRGVILDVKRKGDETEIVLSPSFATALSMDVTSSESEDAYAFYSVNVDNEPQTNMPSMLSWDGVGGTCRDFLGESVIEKYNSTQDKHGISVECAKLGGEDLVSYGFEWCDRKYSGTVKLETVIFTPQSRKSSIRVTAAADNATLSASSLIGTGSGTTIISSVEKIIQLAKNGDVCVIGVGNEISTQFFWNPERVFGAETTEVAGCITES